jgi:hypothetical protein
VISEQVLDNILRERAKVRAIFDGSTISEAHRNTAYHDSPSLRRIKLSGCRRCPRPWRE